MYFRALSAVWTITVVFIEKDAVIGVRSFGGRGPRTIVVCGSIEVWWWSQWRGMLESKGAGRGRSGESRKLVYEFWAVVRVDSAIGVADRAPC